MTLERTISTSVIIPTLDEQHNIESCICSVSAQGVQEIIVADGGSEDDTARLAKAHGATLIPSERGRAKQMNAGASAATGDVLLFLHADCTLADGAIEEMRQQMIAPTTLAGYFRQRIDNRHPFYRLVEVGSNLRARWLRRPYGDQAMFFRSNFFYEIGGFPDVPIMEDLLIARNARARTRLKQMKHSATSSARRWERDGIWSQTLLNWEIAVSELCGIPLPDLASRYKGSRETESPNSATTTS